MTKQILAFFFLLYKRAKPILFPYLLPHLRARTQTLYSPLTLSLYHLSAHTSHTTHRARTQNPTHPTLKIPPSKAYIKET